MSTTISFYVEGERTKCTKCGCMSLMATHDDKSECMGCSGMLGPNYSRKTDVFKLGYQACLDDQAAAKKAEFDRRTKAQRESNRLLFERRAAKEKLDG